MGEWRTAPLNELYEFGSGLSKPRSEFGEGFPFLSFKDVFQNFFVPNKLTELVKSSRSEREQLSIKRGDVFLTRTSETVDELGMSCVALTDVPEATFNGFTKRLRPKRLDIVVPEYVGYFFRSPNFRQSVYAMSSLSTRASLNNEMLARLTIPLPPLEIQTAIGYILKSLDDKIDANQRMNETLEAMARALFKSWFVDFDPVRAKSEGRDPELPSTVANLFSLDFNDDDVPSGWRIGTLEDVADLNPEVWAERNHPEHVEYVDLSNTKWGSIELVEAYDWSDAPSRARRVLRSGDTIVGTVRPGNGSYACVGREGLTGSTGFAVLRPKKPVLTGLVYCAATSTNNIERLSHLADGAAYPAVRPDVVANTPIAIAPSPVVQLFYDKCDPLMARCEANKRESMILGNIRDTLLPKLISGEIRVKDAEKIVEAVA